AFRPLREGSVLLLLPGARDRRESLHAGRGGPPALPAPQRARDPHVQDPRGELTRSEGADYNVRGDRLKRGLVPAVPFVVSLTLSLSTVGANVYWQDSGLFLSAVKDAG